MSGGFPISACVGKAEVMDQWPESPGEAMHTSTFLGHPVGCAMALKSLDILARPETVEMVRKATGECGAIIGRAFEEGAPVFGRWPSWKRAIVYSSVYDF